MRKSMYSIAILVIVMTLLLSFGCPLSQGRYSIGQIGPSGVGTIFYVTPDGERGLEVAPSGWNGTSDDPLSPWSNVSVTVGVEAQHTALFTGLTNTVAIVSQNGHTESAAQLCTAYNGGGLTDWYLPAKDELTQLYAVRNTIGSLMNGAQYWSSSEDGEGNANLSDKTAWFHLFIASQEPSRGGWKNEELANTGGIPDYDGNRVRPIRAF